MNRTDALDDAQAAFHAEIKAGRHQDYAIQIALDAAFVHAENELERARAIIAKERKWRKDDALCVRHAIFSIQPGSDDVQRLISYLANNNTSFGIPRLARATGHTGPFIAAEVARWMENNPGRLHLDDVTQFYRTNRAARSASFFENSALKEVHAYAND
jgi:hypothetical protein